MSFQVSQLNQKQKLSYVCVCYFSYITTSTTEKKFQLLKLFSNFKLNLDFKLFFFYFTQKKTIFLFNN